ncbi:flagellar filament capping protein FliD [Nocardioides sp. J2M5]|uniref:flagellar filament capping protein FliD n=1 Tax=Nocardioides palaemonis TaxID=2829810 RepID=UPI001BA6DE41|nr:flagellar filament capping protein FliD [Nocardioides palaemonis]MBS2940013.1 flagellar filament capping protein FliD [Nocardioides palaemonis]
MSSSASVSGLGSGLDTASIIDQFMQLEASSQTRLKTRQTSEKSIVTILQGINTKLAALATLATDLGKASAWNPVTATSSDTKVAVSATTSAGPGSFSLRVDQTATTHRLELADTVGRTTAGTVPTTVRLDRLDGSTPLDLTTDGTLAGLVTALNDPANATGVRATAVKVGTDQYRLVVESSATGAEEDFTLTATDGSALLGGATVRAGRDAQVTVGDTITATSSSNTFSDLVPGVTVTLAAGATAGTTSEVVLARDQSAASKALKGIIDAVNSVLADIDTQSKASGTGTRGPLAGDTNVRTVRDQLINSVFPGDGTSLADLGIQTDRYGKLVLDESAFQKAYTADPTSVQTRLTASGTGFVTRLGAAAKAASDRVDGTLTTSITGRNDTITRLGNDIADWDIRLELRRSTLTRQFTAMETALNQMNSQSSWLSSQISSLTTSG